MILASQQFPYPDTLAALVEQIRYRDWTFRLGMADRGRSSVGLTLTVETTCPDAYNGGRMRSILHFHPVPPMIWDRHAWLRWLYECCQKMDDHERDELFELVVDGVVEHPFAPAHGIGTNPYELIQHGVTPT